MLYHRCLPEQVAHKSKCTKVIPVNLGPDTLPQSTCGKYLGFHLDRRMTWKSHIKNKAL